MVTHELSFALDVADRMIYMDTGELLEQGSPKDLIRKPRDEGRKRFLGAMSTPDRKSQTSDFVSAWRDYGQDYV